MAFLFCRREGDGSSRPLPCLVRGRNERLLFSLTRLSFPPPKKLLFYLRWLSSPLGMRLPLSLVLASIPQLLPPPFRAAPNDEKGDFPSMYSPFFEPELFLRSFSRGLVPSFFAPHFLHWRKRTSPSRALLLLEMERCLLPRFLSNRGEYLFFP